MPFGSAPNVVVEEPHAFRAVAFSPDGKTLATGEETDEAMLKGAEKNYRLRSLPTTKLRDAATGKVLRTFSAQDGVISVAFSPDGKLLATGGLDGYLRISNVASGEREGDGVHGARGAPGALEYDPLRGIAFSPDGQHLASCADDNTLAGYWGFRRDRGFNSSGVFDRHKKEIRAVAFSPDGTLLASASADRTVKLWEVETRKCVATLERHTLPVLTVAFSPDGKRLASGAGDWKPVNQGKGQGEVKVWDVASRSLVAEPSGVTGLILSVAFSPDGRLLAAGEWGGAADLWDVSGPERPIGP